MEFIFKDDSNQLDMIIKHYLTNRYKYKNYYLTDLEGVSYYEENGTLVLKKKYDTFNRVYFLSNDEEKLTSILSELGTDDAINIPFKKKMAETLEIILEQSGYKCTGIYERMYKNENYECESFNGTFAKPKDVDGIYNLLYDNFDPIPDRLASRKEIEDMVSKNEVLVHYSEKCIVDGLIMFTIDGNKCNFHAWISKSPVSESINLFLEAFNYIESLHISKSTLWVNETNISAKRIYEMLGYKYDGLKDYTFLKIK